MSAAVSVLEGFIHVSVAFFVIWCRSSNPSVGSVSASPFVSPCRSVVHRAGGLVLSDPVCG